MIHISNTAQAHFEKLLAKQEKETQIRVFVLNPNTPNAECGISYCPINTVQSDDVALKFEKFIVYVDEISVPYLENAQIDLVTDHLGSQLVIKAPNAKMKRADKNLPLKERVEYLLKSQINPQLSSHGGYISLVMITDDGYAILKFEGGCNGCSMANLTLKEGIEKHLLSVFPELKGVLDCTKHKKGSHSYC